MFDQPPTRGEKLAVLSGIGLVVAGAAVGLAGQILARQPAYAQSRWQTPAAPDAWDTAAAWMAGSAWVMVLLVLAGFVVLGAGAAAYIARSWRADAVRRANE